MIENKGSKVVCCGKPMNELVANTTEVAVEKHIPVVNIDGNKVKVQVGSTLHLMIPEHYIAWIYVVTNEGIQRKSLDRNGEPVAEFDLNDNEKIIEIYEYCNLHGLWKVEL